MEAGRPSPFDLVCVALVASAIATGPAHSALTLGTAARSILTRDRPLWTSAPKRDGVFLRRALHLNGTPLWDGGPGLILRLSLTLSLKPIERVRATALFESKSWTPPPAPQIATALVKPTPPPFPYRYMGRFTPDGAPQTLYLTKGYQVYSVGVGDVIESVYRVVGITSDEIEVVYLPLGKKQLVSLSSTVPEVHTPDHSPFAPPAPSPENPAPQAAPPRLQPRIAYGDQRGAAATADAPQNPPPNTPAEQQPQAPAAIIPKPAASPPGLPPQ